MAKELKELTKRSENYSQWYNDLVVKADLAEQSAGGGCQGNDGHPSLWICDLGKNATSARRYV